MPAIDTTTYPALYPELRELFQRFEVSGSYAAIEVDTRALQSQGGSAVPTTFYDEVTVYERDAAPLLNPDIVTLHSVKSGEQYTFPRLTADPAMGGTVTAEGAGIVELDTTLSSVNVKPYKYAITQIWSAELEQDNALGLQSVLAQSAGRELGIDVNVHLTTGTGTTQPFGFTTDASAAHTATGTAGGQATDNFFSYFDLVTLYFKVPAPARSRSSWMVSTDAYERIVKMRDANGDPIVQPDLQRGPVMTLLGRPIYENAAMSAAASATTDSIAFGNFKAFHVARLPLRLELSRDYRFNTDELALRAVERIDGRLVDVTAVKLLQCANT